MPDECVPNCLDGIAFAAYLKTELRSRPEDAQASSRQMCGRYDNLIAREAYRLLFRAQRLPQSNFPPRYNIAPTDQVPIIRVDPRDDERELVMARWGLVPWWAKEMPKVPHINARAETVHKTGTVQRGIRQTARTDPGYRLFRVAEAGRRQAALSF